MSQSFGSWRASYSPGSWVVLAGPSSLVVMQPAAPRHSDLISSIWQQVARADGADALLQTLTAIGLSQMPSLGVFFWEGDRMTSLARGDVVVKEASTGRVVNHGDGVVTWREASLDPSIISVEMEQADEGLSMPLLLGVAQASRITIDATGTVPALVVGEQGDSAQPSGLHAVPDSPEQTGPLQTGAAQTGPAQTQAGTVQAGPEQGASFAEVQDLGRAPTGQASPDDQYAHSAGRYTAESPVDQPSSDQYGSDQSSSAQSSSDQYGSAQSGPSSEVPDDIWGSPELPPASSPSESSWTPVPEPPSSRPAIAQPWTPGPPAPAPESSSGWDPQPWQESASSSSGQGWGDPDSSMAHDGATMFMPGLASQGASDAAAGAGLVMASLCVAGHANPPGARRCRLCSAPMDTSGPRLVDRPCLGVLVASTGESIDLLGPVLVGRAPNGGANDPQAALLRVPSPNQDISRTHVRIAPDEWSIEVTDMNSTNGTLVQHPGEEAIRLSAGETVTVEIGAVVDLGDGVTLEIAPPRAS